MTLAVADRPLYDLYDLAMLDLDGVVYIGPEAVAGASDAIAAAHQAGMSLAYVTNNASRPASEVAEHLRSLGLPDVSDSDVVTSAQAVAHMVADALPVGSSVLVVGGPGLRIPLEERGLRIVDSLDDAPAAVVQGFHPDVGWKHLAEASYAIASGIPWFASNTDLAVPTARGIAPGNGALVQAVATATGSWPRVAGKPESALFLETTERLGGQRPLMIGDRLETDIDGAINAGIDSMAVLTGVSTPDDLAAAEVGHRPQFVAPDLYGLMSPHPAVLIEGERATCGEAGARLESNVVRLSSGVLSSINGLRAAIGLAWHIRDRSGDPVRVDGTLGA